MPCLCPGAGVCRRACLRLRKRSNACNFRRARRAMRIFRSSERFGPSLGIFPLVPSASIGHQPLWHAKTQRSTPWRSSGIRLLFRRREGFGSLFVGLRAARRASADRQSGGPGTPEREARIVQLLVGANVSPSSKSMVVCTRPAVTTCVRGWDLEPIAVGLVEPMTIARGKHQRNQWSG